MRQNFQWVATLCVHSWVNACAYKYVRVPVCVCVDLSSYVIKNSDRFTLTPLTSLPTSYKQFPVLLYTKLVAGPCCFSTILFCGNLFLSHTHTHTNTYSTHTSTNTGKFDLKINKLHSEANSHTQAHMNSAKETTRRTYACLTFSATFRRQK